MNKPSRSAKKLLYAFPIAALVYVGLFVYGYTNQGYYQSGFDFTLKRDGYHVLKVVPETAAFASGLREGALIRTVNGIDAVWLNKVSETDLNAFLTMASALFIPGTTVRLEDSRGILYEIPLKILPWNQRLALLELEILIGVFIGTVFILSGIWLLSIGKGDPVITWFLGFTASAGLALASSYFTSYWSAGLIAVRFIVLDISGVAAVIFLAGFVRRFPSTPNLKSSRLIWLPVLALCAKYALIATRVLTFYGPAIYFIHTVLGVSLIYIIRLLIKQYHAATAGGRRKLHWLIAGITLSLVPYIVFVFTLVLYMDMLSSSLIVFSAIANFSILLFPVFVGIGVVRFNLFDIDRFLNRFIVLFFLAFAFTILYSVVFMLFFESTLTLELYLILLLTALLSPTVYLRLDSLVTGILHKGHKDTRQILLEMEQELTGIYRSSSVFPVVSTSLVFAFDPSTIQFIKTDGDTRTLEFSYPATLSMVDHSQTGGVALPLGRQGTGSLVLSLGRKRDDDIYTQDDIHLLTSAASHISKTLQYCELYSQLEESLANESDAQKVAILSLAKLTEYRDEETGKHLERIQEYTRLLALALRNGKRDGDYLSEEYIDALCLSSLLHDIGKVGVPDTILLKPGKLTTEEFSVIQRHTVIGGKVLEDAENIKPERSFLTIGKAVAYHHHERWDGAGYPFGLSGDDIPLSARIVAVADVYDALRSERPYKQPFSHEESVAIIADGAGKHFDPAIIQAFMRIESSIQNVPRD